MDDLLYSQELNYTADFLRDWRSDIEISTAIGQFEAVRAGVGIGICHDFMAVAEPGLVPALSRTSASRAATGLVWHENLRVARRVQAVVDLLDRIVQEERALFRAT